MTEFEYADYAYLQAAEGKAEWVLAKQAIAENHNKGGFFIWVDAICGH